MNKFGMCIMPDVRLQHVIKTGKSLVPSNENL